MTFRDLNIIEPILKAIEEKGYIAPTSIQEKAIPAALAKRDILGCAQTGTGKTASFAIPIIQHLQANKETDKRQGIKALILTPTRELAMQISECIDDYSKYTRVRHGVIFGGVNQRPQVDMLRKGIDILVATPGRLLDLINQGHILCLMSKIVCSIWVLYMISSEYCRNFRKKSKRCFFQQQCRIVLLL